MDSYIHALDVKFPFLAHLEKVEKNLLRNGVVFPYFGACLDNIFSDYELDFTKRVGFMN